MKAEIKRREGGAESTRYGDLGVGDWFMYGGNVWLKTNGTAGAVDPEDGNIGHFDDSDRVIPVQVTITY